MEGFTREHLERLITPERRQAVKDRLEQLGRHFTAHPEETGETYLEHLIFTLKMGGRITSCGILLIIHGVFPFTFRRTVSAQIEKIYAILKGRIPRQRLNDLDENWQI
jgi:NADPH:quinone reductase-like Zn-dependent oxidoreductase